MTRLILVLALVAVGCDAYFQQGLYTRAAVDQIELGIRKLSSTVNEQAGTPTSTPPTSGTPLVAPPPAELQPQR